MTHLDSRDIIKSDPGVRALAIMDFLICSPLPNGASYLAATFATAYIDNNTVNSTFVFHSRSAPCVLFFLFLELTPMSQNHRRNVRVGLLIQRGVRKWYFFSAIEEYRYNSPIKKIYGFVTLREQTLETTRVGYRSWIYFHRPKPRSLN